MKKVFFLGAVLTAVLLCGCQKTQITWETVDDTLLTEYPTQDAAYTVLFDVPADAVLAEDVQDREVYRQKDGAYEIVSQTLGTCDLDRVVKTLSGYSADEVDILHTTRCGMEECQFVWCSADEDGTKICRADAVFDAPYCYCLTFSAKEDTSCDYITTQQQVFSSMSLFESEGF